MTIPESPENSSGALPSGPSPQSEEITAAINATLQQKQSETMSNQQIIDAAQLFANSPTQNLKEIVDHVDNIGAILFEYGEREEPEPPDIVTLNGRLNTLLCRHYIAVLRVEIEKDPRDMTKIQRLLLRVVPIARVLSREYGDATLFDEIQELKRGIGLA